MMWNVRVQRYKDAAKNRGLEIVANDDGTASIGDVTFQRDTDVEEYLANIPRIDLQPMR